MKTIIVLTFIFLIGFGCTKKVPCSDREIQMVFVGYTQTELDTIVVRKFQPKDNYQHLIDTVTMFYDSKFYYRSNDTTFVYTNNHTQEIKAHYDWQIFIPATNRTTLISSIVTEQATTKCSTLAPATNCNCINKIFSLKSDNTSIDLSTVNQEIDPYRIYITK